MKRNILIPLCVKNTGERRETIKEVCAQGGN